MPPPRKKKGLKKRRAIPCRFCREHDTEIDYKDLNSLQKLVSSQGKHLARKRTGNCARHQRASRRAIKRARFLALMPFTG